MRMDSALDQIMTIYKGKYCAFMWFFSCYLPAFTFHKDKILNLKLFFVYVVMSGQVEKH